MLQLIFVAIALLVSVQARADEIDDALARAGLVEKLKPDGATFGADYFCECNSSWLHEDYVVVQRAGSVRIVRKHRVDAQPEFSAGRIKYVSENQGEFGGKLEAVWPDKRKRMLIRENVSAIIQSGKVLYVFTGLNHMFADTGAVYRISSFDKSPKVSKVTLLPGEPLPLLDSRRKAKGPLNIHSRFEHDPGFIIITNENLLALRPYIGWLDTISHHPVWENLDPNSAVQVGDRVLVGLCAGVAVIEFHREYYLKNIRMFVPEKPESGSSRGPCQ